MTDWLGRLVIPSHLLIQWQRTDIDRTLTILPQPWKTSKQRTRTPLWSQTPGSPRLHRQPHKGTNRSTGCIDQGSWDDEDILWQKASKCSQLREGRQSLVGRVQHHHDMTKQEVGRKAIWTLWKEGLTAYQLQLPTTWEKIHPIFNKALLTPYKPPSYLQQQLPQPAPPIIIEGDEEYEVDEILDSQMRNSKLQYLVCRKDYPTHTDWTWEPESNITHALEVVKDFHTKHPSAPRHLPLNTRTVTFRWIPNDNIPIHIPWRLQSSTGKVFNWEDGIFKQHNGDQDTHLRTGVMSWTNTFHFLTYLLPLKDLARSGWN